MKILHFEDDSLDAELTARELRKLGRPFSILRVATQEEFETALDREKFDVIISDSGIPGNSIDVLALAREKQPAVPLVFLSGSEYPGVQTEAINRGAAAFVNKRDLTDLPKTLCGILKG